MTDGFFLAKYIHCLFCKHFKNEYAFHAGLVFLYWTHYVLILDSVGFRDIKININVKLSRQQNIADYNYHH